MRAAEQCRRLRAVGRSALTAPRRLCSIGNVGSQEKAETTKTEAKSEGSFVKTTVQEAEEWQESWKQLLIEWTRNSSLRHPLYLSPRSRYWENMPEGVEGCHVVDMARMVENPHTFVGINDACKQLQAKHGVHVEVLMLGDSGSFTAHMLASAVGRHRMLKRLDVDPYQNIVMVVCCRKAGTMSTYVGRGLKHVIDPLFLHRSFNEIFKVYFRGRDWDVKVAEYVTAISGQVERRQRWVARSGPVFIPPLTEYWWAVLFVLSVAMMLLADAWDAYKYWGIRYCDGCKEYMVVFDDDDMLWRRLTLGQRKEVELDCVKYKLWKCPAETCETHYVEEVKWNSLRVDCLICQSCKHRTSHGKRTIATVPDDDNYGEAINLRECKFCGFTEAWTTMMSSNFGEYVSTTTQHTHARTHLSLHTHRGHKADHDRPLQGDYGSDFFITFRMSTLARFFFGGMGAPEVELRKVCYTRTPPPPTTRFCHHYPSPFLTTPTTYFTGRRRPSVGQRRNG